MKDNVKPKVPIRRVAMQVREQRRRSGHQWMWLVTLAICASGCEPFPGKLREQWERSNQTVRVRAEIYDEESLSHRLAIFDERRCHLRLLSAPAGSDRWRQFGNAYFSPCESDLKSRVRFVDERTAYAFMQWWFKVTTDGGRTWSTWDVAAHLPGRAFYNPNLIEEVSIKPDGTGTMTLNPQGLADKVRLTLYTEDFGQRWTIR